MKREKLHVAHLVAPDSGSPRLYETDNYTEAGGCLRGELGQARFPVTSCFFLFFFPFFPPSLCLSRLRFSNLLSRQH